MEYNPSTTIKTVSPAYEEALKIEKYVNAKHCSDREAETMAQKFKAQYGITWTELLGKVKN